MRLNLPARPFALTETIWGQMKSTIADLLRNGPAELDLLTWMSRTALELVGQGGMGYSFDSLGETPEKHGELLRDLVYVPWRPPRAER